MRRWLPFLLMLLLALRGLVGDAMAGQMLAQQLATPQSTPMAAVQVMAGHDCDSHGHHEAASSQPEAAGEAQAPGDCPTCASCQVCSSVAMTPSPVVALALPPARTQPQQAGAAYPSAEPALAFKPPRG